MIRHAVRATVAVAALSLAVLSSLVQAQDTSSAQELTDLRALAEAGDIEAQYNLGVYAAGRGVSQDAAEAVTWFRRAAEQGHAGAQFTLGVMLAAGEGIPEDDVEAVAWFRRAAEQGHAGAQLNLGVMYAAGSGVPQDNVEAHMWLNLAASRSSGEQRELAVPKRDAVAERMTPADLSEAQRRAREWYAAHPVP